MRSAVIICILSFSLVPILAGCGSKEVVEKPSKAALKSPTDRLTESELQKFLRLVSRLPDGQVPEFTPATRPDVDLHLPAKALVSEFRSRFRFLCDPRRQGEVWNKNKDLVKSTRLEGWTTAQLAAFMRCLSCAVMKSKFSAKHDLTEIENRCREEIAQIVKAIEVVDERPRASKDGAFQKMRGEKLERLDRMIALLEFTLQIKPVPKENVELVKEMESQIRGLLPKAAMQDPYEAPFATKTEAEGSESNRGIVPVGYETK